MNNRKNNIIYKIRLLKEQINYVENVDDFYKLFITF